MIEFSMIRTQNKVRTVMDKKFHKNLASQINKGMKSSAFKEIQTLDIKFNDSPVKRFLMRAFDLGEELQPVKMKAKFVRSSIGNFQKYEFEDTFSGDQITLLKKGKSLVNRKGSFLNKLVKNINKVIEEG